MKYAWIENNVIRDIASGDPSDTYHPNIAALYSVKVPDEASNGDSFADGYWSARVVEDSTTVVEKPAAVIPPKVTPLQYKLLFTPMERVAINSAKGSDPLLEDLFSILDDLRLTEVDLALASTQESLDYLEYKGLLASGRKAEILTGQIR